MVGRVLVVGVVVLAACGGDGRGDEDGYDGPSEALVETELEDCVPQAVIDGLACEGIQIPRNTCLGVALACQDLDRLGYDPTCTVGVEPWHSDCGELARLGAEVDACTDSIDTSLWPEKPLIYECPALH